MRPLIGPLIVCVLAAIATHIGALVVLPSAIMGRALTGMATPQGVNMMVARPRADASARAIVRPSPDLLYSTCVFDVSEGPVTVSFPKVTGTYVSVAFYDEATNNFFAVNDTQAPFDVIEAVIATGAQRPQTDMPVIFAPGKKGLVLVRLLINDEARLAELEAARQSGTCAPFAPPVPPDVPAPLPKPETP